MRQRQSHPPNISYTVVDNHLVQDLPINHSCTDIIFSGKRQQALDSIFESQNALSNPTQDAVGLEERVSQAGMMNGRHLPAGQGMPPDVGRRRPYNQHPHPHQHHQQYPPQMYNNYMQPYGANYYPQQLPPQYHNAPMQHPYAPYPPYPHIRSPPPAPMQQHYNAPVPHPPSYPRPQQSPAMPPPYQVPPPQAPSSTRLAHTVPAPMTPPTPALAVSVPPQSIPPQDVPQPQPSLPEEPPAPEEVVSPVQEEPSVYIPFRAPLPWLSRSDLSFPTRRTRRKRKPAQELSAKSVELPEISQVAEADAQIEDKTVAETAELEIQAAEEASIARPETPATSLPASEDNNSTNPTTPSSSQQQYAPAPGDTTPIAPKPVQRPAVVPIVPALPKPVLRDAPKAVPEKMVVTAPAEEKASAGSEQNGVEPAIEPTEEIVIGEVKEQNTAPKAWTTPKLWTGLFNPNATTSNAASSDSGQGTLLPGGVKPTSESMAEALRSFNAVSTDAKVSFLEPRGLVNTGNMCYMNSVLQVLVFCGPFYNFLDQVSKRAAHSFKSETPLLDAMILFMREFKVIDSATSVEKLRMRLKEGELEKYGDAFTPDFVYNVINRLPRFSSMRQGHQQDAEEFLGFLLDGLHEECVHVMRSGASNTTSAMATPINGPSSPVSEVNSIPESTGQENGWLEVGPKQKAAITRSSGTITTGSPLTKIFGGNLRSELRVPGLKDSVTLEPYQPLQLDIGAPNVNNIIDALKGLTHSESLHGDFKSPKGPNVTATKQVFIETLPPVLILHLKRFQYDNAGGTQKIWKKVGYPLELEIPKEVFPRQKRGVYAHSGLPKYKLIAVVYHHGKNASGGHYTVDVRRQEGREWVRLDDTVIRRVRSEDVAEGGAEEDPKIIAAALEAHKKDIPVSGNGFAAIEDAEGENEEDGWKKASGSGKKWSAVANGASTPKAKSDKFSVKDNKVAYLLFYQKI